VCVLTDVNKRGEAARPFPACSAWVEAADADVHCNVAGLKVSVGFFEVMTGCC